MDNLRNPRHRPNDTEPIVFEPEDKPTCGSNCALKVILILTVIMAAAILAVFAYDISRFYSFRGRDPPLLFCYYSNNGPDDLPPEKINATLCTHIIFLSLDTANNSIVLSEDQQRVVRKLVDLKLAEPELKVMVSTGANMSDISLTADNRKAFAQSAVKLLNDYKLDGLDIDWEFPAWNGSRLEDRDNFILLLQELRTNFDAQPRRLLLTTAVAAPFTIIEVSYRIKDMADFIDYALLMGYDYFRYNPLFPFAEFNSPLFPHKGQVNFLTLLNLRWSSIYWNERGMPLNKLVIGMPYYGVTFTLAEPDLHDVGALINGTGFGGGTVSYPGMCDFLNAGGQRVFNNESMVPFAYHDTDWVSYDDTQSVAIKASWIIDNNFAGVMTFSLNLDDWQSHCNKSDLAFPLQRTVYNATKYSWFLRNVNPGIIGSQWMSYL